jgi:tetratricopeptide (TPR) repeat protein
MILLFIIVLILTLGIIAAFLLNAQRKNRMERALACLENGEYDEALKYFTELYKKNSTNKTINWYIGLCHENMGNLELALVEYQKVALSTAFLPPLNEAEIHERIAMINLNLNNIDKAVQEFRIVAALEPKNANALYHVGIIERDSGDLQAAITTLGKTVKANDSFVMAHLELGKLNYNLNYLDRAKKSLRRAIQIDQSLSEAHLYYALTLEKMRNFKEAIEEFQIALRESNYAFDSYLHLGHIYMELSNSVQAFECFEKAIVLDTDDVEKMAELKYTYANYLVGAGELNRALQLWKEVQSLLPDYRDTLQKIEIYGEVGRSENLTRLLTSTKQEFLAAGLSLCRQLHVRVESHSFGQENFVEFKGSTRLGREDTDCIVHFARWTSQVGEIPVRELLERMTEENAGKGYFITTSLFSAKALNHAKVRPINLIDRKKLEGMLTKVYS